MHEKLFESIFIKLEVKNESIRLSVKFLAFFLICNTMINNVSINFIQ